MRNTAIGFSPGAQKLTLSLRGFDAIHLAAMLDLVAAVGADKVAFSSFDRQPDQAARVEGCRVLDVSSKPIEE